MSIFNTPTAFTRAFFGKKSGLAFLSCSVVTVACRLFCLTG